MNSALIGIGNISSTHIDAVLAAGQKIVALCDTVLEKALAANERYRLNAKIFADYKEMLESCDIDCVHILTPHYLHKEMIIYALEKNVNVLCEKPLCMNIKEINDIEKVLKKSNAKLGVCFQNRFSSSNILLFDLLKGQEIVGGFANVIWRRDKNYYCSADWRGKKATEGGGVLINQAIHTLDLLIKAAGMPRSVIAHCHNDSLKDVIEVEDTVSVLLKYKDKTINFFATVAASADLPVQIVIKTKEHTYFSQQDNIVIDGKLFPTENGKNMIKECWGDGHKKLITDFYNSISENKPFEIDFYEGTKVIKVIDSIYNSGGKEIPL
jgi:predicted dehydrogenase